MAPNNQVKGGLSHSAQKKEAAAAKKPEKEKGPGGNRKESKVQPMICKICRVQTNSGADLKIHYESKHPKETYDEATCGIRP